MSGCGSGPAESQIEKKGELGYFPRTVGIGDIFEGGPLGCLIQDNPKEYNQGE